MPALDFDLRCAQCHQSLRGVCVAECCPACAAPVFETLDPAAIDGETLAVVEDTPCVRCGYDLRTARLGTRCPECGAGVIASVRPDFLHFANVKWLDRVKGGWTNLLIALVALAVLILLIWAMENGGAGPDRVSIILGIVLAVCVPVLGGMGVVRATTQEPLPARKRRGELIRYVARFGILSPVLLYFVGPMLPFLVMGPSVVFLILIPVLFFAGLLGMTILAHRFAQRGRGQELSMGVWALSFVWAVCGLLATGATVIGSIAMSRSVAVATPYAAGPAAAPPTYGPSWLDGALDFTVGALVWVGLPLSLLGSILVLIALRSMFTTAIAQAPDIEDVV